LFANFFSKLFISEKKETSSEENKAEQIDKQKITEENQQNKNKNKNKKLLVRYIYIYYSFLNNNFCLF